MSDPFGRRLRDLVEGIRAEAEGARVARAGDVAAMRARRRHLERVATEEARKMLGEAASVLAGLGLRWKATPEELRIEAIPGARSPEAYPPWLLLRCRPPASDDTMVAVLEVTWRVDDPRTPLPEGPCTMRLVVSDDSPAGVAEIRDFLAVSLEDFAASVTKFDTLPRA